MKRIKLIRIQNKKKKLIIDPTERKNKSDNDDTFVEGTIVNVIDHNNETTEVEENVNEEELDGDADAEDLVNLTDNWIEILSLFNDEDEANSIKIDKIFITEMCVEVSTIRHDKSTEYRMKKLLQTSNDTSCKQEKLKGARKQRITLSTLFPNKIKLPQPNEE